jgi:chromosome segregation ATPase
LIEENELLAIDRQHLQAVRKELDLAMAWLDQYTDRLEIANQKQADHDSTVHSLMGKLSSSRKATERVTAQFNLTLDQQNKQIEKLRATLSQARSYESSDFGQTEDESCKP